MVSALATLKAETSITQIHLQRGGIKDDKENFVKLVRSLKSRLTRRGKLVTAALGATSTYIREAYAPLRELCE